MAFNIYIENGQTIPAIAINTIAPAGYTMSSNPTLDWESYAKRIVSEKMLTVAQLRAEIFGEYVSVTWGNGTLAQKKVWSKWFVATKAERDIVHNSVEQEANAIALAKLLQTTRFDPTVSDLANAIKDVEPTAVDNKIQDVEQSNNTIVTSGIGSKVLYDDGTYKAVGATDGYLEIAASEMSTLKSARRKYLASSGRELLSHSGRKNSNTYCGVSFALNDWLSGGKIQIYCTSSLDGVKFFKYYVTVTIWSGTTKTQETLYFTKTLTATVATYPQLTTNEVALSANLLSAMGNGNVVSLKCGRDAGDGDDDYKSSCYTELLTFKYNY